MPRPRLSDDGVDPKVLAKRLQARRLRAAAHARGEQTGAEKWWLNNRKRHRSNVAKWRAGNFEQDKGISRSSALLRRSTAWGTINNRMWNIVHGCVMRGSRRPSKYTIAIGYLWSDLRAHLGAQFRPGMTWENWGRARGCWQLDHKVPLSTFQYVSLEDPLFRQAWALTNLQPLWHDENVAKGKKLNL